MSENNFKTVLVTGTTSGIGFAIEENLAKQGYKIFGCARRKLNKENYLSVNLSTYEACAELFKSAKKYLGKIDILINNAGCYIYSPIEKTSLKDIENITKLNFLAPYYLSALVLEDMKKNKWGRIINIGSISGNMGEGNATLYSATKSALLGLTKSLALEVARDNITVNLINPGWVKTALADKAMQEGISEEENLDIIPQKRFIEPYEIANLVKYLISDEAKGLTGQAINLCAGLSVGC